MLNKKRIMKKIDTSHNSRIVNLEIKFTSLVYQKMRSKSKDNERGEVP